MQVHRKDNTPGDTRQGADARGWLVLAAIVAVLAIGYTVVGFFGVPRLIRSQVVSFIQQHYGRQASIGEVRFNPFTFALEANEFRMPDADGQPLVGFKRLSLDLDIASLWRRAPSFKAIAIEQPFARTVIRRDGSLNFADLARPFSETKPAAPPSKPLRMFVDSFRVLAGEAQFEDQTHPTPFRAQLRPITFELRDFSTVGNTGNVYSLRANSSAGERFTWEGTLKLDPLTSRGRFEVNDLLASTVWSYLRDSLPFEISSGKLALAGTYSIDAAKDVDVDLQIPGITVSDLSIRPKQSETDYLKALNVQVSDIRLNLQRRHVDIGQVRLQGGVARVWRTQNGQINLLDLMPPAGEPSQPATTSPASPPASGPQWSIASSDLAVQGLRIEAEDRSVRPAAAFVLAPIDVNVRGFTSELRNPLDVETRIGIDKGGELVAQGKVHPDTNEISAHVKLSGFDLKSIQPYLATYTQVQLQSGVTGASLDIQRAPNGLLKVKGDAELAQLRTTDERLHQDLLKFGQLRLKGIDYVSEPASLRIASVSARDPYARLIIAPDQTLNIAEVMTPAHPVEPPVVVAHTPAAPPRAPAKSAPMSVRIDSINIANGSANFADFWIQPNYAVSIQGMGGTIAGLSSDPSSRATVALEGKVDRYAPAKIGGTINLLSAALFTDLKVSFKGVEMTSVTPYSGRFAGYKIEKGKLSIDVAYQVENRKLKAEQRFVIDQLQLGEQVESPDAVHLPLRLAVALLKDRNGVIDIQLPLTGSLDDPQFRVGPLIWKAFVGLLTKIATAPFALLGSLFGGNESMSLIDFEPGSAALDATAQERMGSLLKALNERPQLQLEVPTLYSSEIDRPVLARQRVEEKLGQSGTPAERFDVLEKQYHEAFGAEAALPAAAASVAALKKQKRDAQSLDAANAELTTALISKEPIAEHDLEELGQSRAHAVQDALLASGEIDAGRVFILGAAETPPANNKVQLKLSLR